MMHHVTKPTSPHRSATVEFYSTPFGSYASPSVYCTNILLSVQFHSLCELEKSCKDSIAHDADAHDAMHVVLYIKFSI